MFHCGPIFGDITVNVVDIELLTLRLRLFVASAQTAREADDQLIVLAHQHDAVVRAVFQRQPVLPLRFGTVLRDPQAAARLLADHHELASSGLDRVDGHREWGVCTRPGRPDDDDVALDGLSGTQYLALRRKRLAAAEHNRRRGSEHAAVLHAALARLATNTIMPRAGRSPALLLAPVMATARAQVSLTDREHTEERLAFLVPTSELDTARAAITNLSNAADIDAECVGPLPAYNFLTEPTQPQTKANHTPTSRWGW